MGSRICLPAVGNVPLEWYKNEDHIGYDKDGKRIAKSQRKDRLEQLLDRNDNRKVSGGAGCRHAVCVSYGIAGIHDTGYTTSAWPS
jgi:hypothetical protein